MVIVNWLQKNHSACLIGNFITDDEYGTGSFLAYISIRTSSSKKLPFRKLVYYTL